MARHKIDLETAERMIGRYSQFADMSAIKDVMARGIAEEVSDRVHMWMESAMSEHGPPWEMMFLWDFFLCPICDMASVQMFQMEQRSWFGFGRRTHHRWFACQTEYCIVRGLVVPWESISDDALDAVTEGRRV